ncbi:unnamed protein product [Spirodela intermedia]|uniref:Phosphotyrosine protein phosphatase I domain-containing protein n=1 Tax=Spirodela intermedia TaxID=51605 RepID=A0A7I8JG79_SPIIN|nr:unnamed protein product [Spirodela intermedia]CAA6668513.1 unnamed protein product [Spirodela intermedia]
MASSYLFAGTAGPPSQMQLLPGRRFGGPPFVRFCGPGSPSPPALSSACLPRSSISGITSYSSHASASVRPTPSAAAADSADSAASSRQPQPFSVLFVCLGVFSSLVTNKGLDAHFKIDSAGPSAITRNGDRDTSISRPIRPSDFKDFDLILAMDLQNKDDILAKYELWSFKEPLPADAQRKVKLICSYCTKHRGQKAGSILWWEGFEKFFDPARRRFLQEGACEAALDEILADSSST